MTTLSPIKVPPPPEDGEPKVGNDGNKEDKQALEQLRSKIMLDTDEGKFKFSREVVKKAPPQYLKEIESAYYRQRSLVFVRKIIKIGAHIIAHVLRWADLIGKDEVKDVITDIIGDVDLEQDVLWLFGDLLGKVPCPGFVGVVGGVGVRIVKHKFGKGAAAVAGKVAGNVRNIREEVKRERSDSLSSVSSLSDVELV